MTATPPLFHLLAPPQCDVAIRPFTIEGELHVGVIVKLGLDLRLRSADPTGPLPIALRDKYPTERLVGSIAAAADTAPRKRACDVTLTGFARTPGGQPAQTLPVRLAVYRGNVPLLRKAIVAVGPVGASGALEPITTMPLVYERALGGPEVVANPAGSAVPSLRHLSNAELPGCLAPIPSAWSVRKDRLDGKTRDSLTTFVPALGAHTDWDYFQSAPPDQIVTFLQGGEWIVIDGVSQTMPRIQTRLPFIDVRAWVALAGREPIAVPLAWDTLAIEGETLAAGAVWRGDIVSPLPLPETRDMAIVITVDASAAAPQATSVSRMPTIETSQLLSPSNLVEAIAEEKRPSLAATAGLSALDHMYASQKPVAPYALGTPGQTAPKVAMLPGAPWAHRDTPAPPAPAAAQQRTEEMVAAGAPPPQPAPQPFPPSSGATPAPPSPMAAPPAPFVRSPSAPPPPAPPLASPQPAVRASAADEKAQRSRLELAAAGLRRSGMSEAGIAQVLRELERELGSDA